MAGSISRGSITLCSDSPFRPSLGFCLSWMMRDFTPTSSALLRLSRARLAYALVMMSTNPSVLKPVVWFVSMSTMGRSCSSSDTGDLRLTPSRGAYTK